MGCPRRESELVECTDAVGATGCGSVLGARWIEGWCVDVYERSGSSGEGVGIVA